MPPAAREGRPRPSAGAYLRGPRPRQRRSLLRVGKRAFLSYVIIFWAR